MVSKLLSTAEEHAWIDFLLDEGVFRLGDFTLKSGARSPFFLNFGELHAGHQLQTLGETFGRASQSLTPTPNLLFGPAYKGIPLAVATATAIGDGCNYFSFRKEAKTHGDAGALLGATPDSDSRILLVDDVLTTAGTKIEAIEQLKQHSHAHGYVLQWSGVLVGCDRQQKNEQGQLWSDLFDARTGVPIFALTDISALLERARSRGWPAEQLDSCREFLDA